MKTKEYYCSFNWWLKPLVIHLAIRQSSQDKNQAPAEVNKWTVSFWTDSGNRFINGDKNGSINEVWKDQIDMVR